MGAIFTIKLEGSCGQCGDKYCLREQVVMAGSMSYSELKARFPRVSFRKGEASLSCVYDKCKIRAVFTGKGETCERCEGVGEYGHNGVMCGDCFSTGLKL